MVRTRAATPVTGMPALVGLLFVVFVIAGLLVYEAWSTGQSRREIAQRGLQDYAAYATWSTARAGDAALGSSLSMLFRGLMSSRIQRGRPLPPLSVLVSAAKDIDDCDCTLRIPADYYFRVDFRDNRVVTAPGGRSTTPEPAPSGWAAAKIGSFAPTESPNQATSDGGEWLSRELASQRVPANAGFGVIFVTRGDSSSVVGFVAQRDSVGNVVGMLGFVGSPQAYASTLFTHLWRQPKILPMAITRGMPNDSLLTALVTTAQGREIYRSSGWEPSLLSDTASLAQFGGGMRVRVALRRDAMARLGGGLVPASRVPVWVGLLLLTGVLAVIIIRNLQREHELARLRADFTASVSHELRTPLAQILLFGETLTLGRTRSDSERHRAAEVIVREAQRLIQMVENTLQFSRSDRPAVVLSPEPLRLAPAVRDVIAGIEPLAAMRDVRIVSDLDENSTGLVDRAALRQMLVNLLDNALKYGPAGQTVRVSLSAPESTVVLNPAILAPKQVTRRDVVRIAVDDQGPGIWGSSREDIWAPFVRGGNGASSPATGCGLGLAVVRELATRHNGRAWVETAPAGVGSRFVIELPAASARSSVPSAEADDGEIVEDESKRGSSGVEPPSAVA
jgi:signal transduction histidine kinase